MKLKNTLQESKNYAVPMAGPLSNSRPTTEKQWESIMIDKANFNKNSNSCLTHGKKKNDIIQSYFANKKIKKGFPFSRSLTDGKTVRQNKKKLYWRSGFLLSKKGQGLIEYLILVALMGVATIGIVRTLNQTVKTRFANAIYALQGKSQKAKTHSIRKEEYQRSDLSNFMSGAASTDKKKKKK